MPRWSDYFIRQIQLLSRSKCARPTAALLALLFVMPMAALAQGSPFDTGFNSLQTLFTGAVAKVASLIAIVSAAVCLAQFLVPKA
jgi:type IV secretory pathway VirB2 component (pilin)